MNPELTITPSTATAKPGDTITATVSYLGTGTISVEGQSDSDYWSFHNIGTFSYDNSSKTLTVDYSIRLESDIGGGEVDTYTVSLSAADGYDAATATLKITIRSHHESLVP